ncbi:MAG: DUF4493 domain-containing protein [Odoribacter sp.]|nr:DUF4493 domain-containing protein [Odoribacter sp.]
MYGYVSFSFEITGNFEIVTNSRAGEDIDINEFTVRISGTTLRGTVYDSIWNKYSEMSSVLAIPAGSYTLEAYNGEQRAGFETPYYYGEKDFEIGIQEVVQTQVICKLACVELTVNFSELFLSNIENGVCRIYSQEGQIVMFTPEETRKGYIAVPADSTLVVSVTGVYVETGDDLKQTYYIESIKPQQSHVINLSVTTISIIDGNNLLVVDHSVNEQETNVLVPGGNEVIDNNGDKGTWDDEDGNGGEEPGPGESGDEDKPSIKGDGFDIDNVLVVSTAEAEAGKAVDVEILAPNGGIANLFLWMESGDSELNEIFQGLDLGNKNNPGDLANASNETWVEILQGIGIIDLQNPIYGTEKYIFSVGAFMELLTEGYTHKFHIALVDGGGERIEKTLVIQRVG